MLIQTKDELAVDSVGAATSMKLIKIDKGEAQIGVPQEIATALELADIVHDRLAALPEEDLDRVLLDTYAWIVAECDRRGEIAWLYEMTGKEFADEAKKGLHPKGATGMNPTKLPALRRWLSFMGLGVPLPINTSIDFPSPASRLAREIARSDLNEGGEISARDFLTKLSSRMPYLDGGAMFRAVCERIKHKPGERRLSPLFSVALRDLHDEGALRLRPRGDSADSIRLAPDPAHEVQTFNTIQIIGEEGATA
jgi:hypothetical protein